jgi:nicotinamide-nucleotide amidase
MLPEATLGKRLLKKNLTIAVAESCTGGLVSNRITNINGSSRYFLCGVIAYSNEIKKCPLNVSDDSLKRYGAVSGQVAAQMAEGVRLLANTDIGVGVTGVAGPTGGTRAKPVGLVHIGIVTGKKVFTKEFRFKGSRKRIKQQASTAALNLICAHLSR